MVLDRREFIRNSAMAGLGLTFLPNLSFGNSSKQILNLAFIKIFKTTSFGGGYV